MDQFVLEAQVFNSLFLYTKSIFLSPEIIHKKMQQKAIPRLFMVQRLYRRILKLHRHLPVELQKLGDDYAKDEFRRHKGANQLQAHEFMNEWKAYANTLEAQYVTRTEEIGRNLEQVEVEALSQEQLGQLFQLQQEALNPPLDDDSKV